MNLGYKKLLNDLRLKKPYFNDLHIVRFYSSYVAISNGKVIAITDNNMTYCPLAKSLYKNLNFTDDNCDIKKLITEAIEEKIKKFGHFSKNRELIRSDIAVPYGASEMLMYAMRKKAIDASVVVCDGAGTVIVDKPELVQGIGARMNGLFFTTPIYEIIEELKKHGCHIVSFRAAINQLEGVKKAISLGHKNVAVTMNVAMEESFSMFRDIEKQHNINLTLLAVCATGASESRVNEIGKYADLVWSCASSKLREVIAQCAVVQVSKKIPVFVLTKKGLDFLSRYSSDEALIQDLDLSQQYIISNDCGGQCIKIGMFKAFISQINLPVRDKKEPKFYEINK
ncbi:MAG: DUF2099 family protein [Candidatus Omnitrophica bacterium]|nr:DUF2099 family protein [Candidatus Omnitrophota bacterium]